MRVRFALSTAVAVAASLAVIPAGLAAQPHRSGGNVTRTPGATAALAAHAQFGLGKLHMVSGVVRDPAGRALSGICVLAAGPDGQAQMARTSAGGRYQLSLPGAGRYTMQYRDCQPGRASMPAFAAAPAQQIEVGGAAFTTLAAATIRLGGPASDSTRSALEAAGVIAAEHPESIVLQPGEEILQGHATEALARNWPTATITGRVISPSRRGLAGICVWIVGKTFAAGTATTKNGTYKFQVVGGGIPRGKYPVEFDSNCNGDPGPPPVAPGRWAPEWYKNAFSQAKATKVALRTGKTTRGINAVMRPGGEVSGTLSGSDHRPISGGCAVLTDAKRNEFGLAFTNAKGRYTITGLDPGRYRLVGVSGCRTGNGDYRQTWYPRAASIKNARVITVRLGHRTTGISVVLPKLGTITGVIRVGGKSGKPLGGMCVDVYSPTNINAYGFATSQPNGIYVVPGLPAGSYQVQAQAGGCGNNGNYAPASYPSAVRAADGRTTAGINLYMQPGGILTGTVTDAATAKPIAGICVSDGNFNGAQTGPNGTYTINRLPAEHATVGFFACGSKMSYAPQFYPGQAVQEAAEPVTVTAGQVTAGINAAMLPGASIAGRVTDSAGRPVRGVCIDIVPLKLAPYGNQILGGETWTNASGSYVVTDLAPGNYAVAFFSGYCGPANVAVLQWFKGQSAEAKAGLVNARAGVETVGIDAVVGRGGGISGTVTSAGGMPVQFDCVTAINRRTGLTAGFQSLRGDGTYILAGLPAGSYTVVASDCYLGENLAQSVYPRAVSVRTGRTTPKIALTLPAGGIVNGRVTVASTGRPVVGACVEAIPVSNQAASLGIGALGITGSSGTYRIAGLRTGTYFVSVFSGCGGPAANLQSVTLAHSVGIVQGKVKSGVNAALHVGGQVTGQITGPGATAVPGACAEAFEIPGGLAAETTADSHGDYVLTGLTPGTYKMRFGDPSCSDSSPDLGLRWYATEITVTAGGTVSGIDGSLPATGTITGSVTGTGSAPLTGVCVSAVPVAAAQRTIYSVSAAGSYTLADLQPGKYRVEFQAGCGKTGVQTQWWQGAKTSGGAKIINVSANATISGIDAALIGG